VYQGRTEGMNPYKERLAARTEARTLDAALKGADVFVGLSVAGCVAPDMLRSMARRPVIFAMANPVPEISYEAAKAARPDAIMATGRSDYPNQVNNVLGFPFIFRGALDVRARTINTEMKIAATHALARPAKSPRFEAYVEEYYRLRQRRGITRSEAREQMLSPNYFGAMMVHMGDADGFLAGVSHYPDTIRPALQIINMRKNVVRVSGVYVIITKQQVYFFSDTTVNIEPTAEDLAEIATLAAEVAREFSIEPRVAMISFSNFGSTRHPLTEKVRRATELVRQRCPDLIVDGEVMADTAVVPEIMEQDYPFSRLRDGH